MSGFQVTRLLAGSALLLLLAGCDPFSKPRTMMDEYVERVGQVLDIEPELSGTAPVQQIPRRRDRMLPLPDLELGMLDFLSLYGCELQYVVGEKNSVMGRVMQPLNRLRYEVNFIRTAGDCIETINNDELKETLEQAIASKRATLPVAIWNATWGVEEAESLFTLAKGAFPVEPEASLSDLSREARQLNKAVAALKEDNLEVDLGFWGQVHQRWQAEHRGGQLLTSASLVATRLDDATHVIQKRLAGRPLCLNGKPNNQSDIVQSMFYSVYIGKVQPYLASLRRARADLIEPLSELAAMQASVMPEPFRQWYQWALAIDGEKSAWVKLDAAISDHTRSWQLLLEQCGLRPGV